MYKPIIYLFFGGFILLSCVENRIFIQIHPDQNTYFKFESRGDSLDIFNFDFLHPMDLVGWTTSFNILEDGNDTNYYHITEGILEDQEFVFFNPDKAPLGYGYKQTIKNNWLSSTYEFSFIFFGRNINMDYPQLNKAILNQKIDSLSWAPEVFKKLIEKTMIEYDKSTLFEKSDFPIESIMGQLNNTLINSDYINQLVLLNNTWENIFNDLIQSFNLKKDTANRLTKIMRKNIEILQSTIDLNDDRFIIKLLMPGQIIGTNSHTIKKDTLIWNFGIDSLLSNDFKIKSSSIVYDIKLIQKTLILVSIIGLLGVIHWFRFRH